MDHIPLLSRPLLRSARPLLPRSTDVVVVLTFFLGVIYQHTNDKGAIDRARVLPTKAPPIVFQKTSAPRFAMSSALYSHSDAVARPTARLAKTLS
jgi:hypothetical protein